MRPDRKVVLSDNGNFPTDLYIAKGRSTSSSGYELKLVAPEGVEDAIDDSVAVLMLTEVDYRTGRIHDMARRPKAHGAGAMAIWDLGHSAGAVTVDLAGSGADSAVGLQLQIFERRAQVRRLSSMCGPGIGETHLPGPRRLDGP